MDKPSIEKVVSRDTKSRAAIVFVHGYSGDGQGTWRDMWPRILEDSQLGTWDAWLVKYGSRLLPDALVGVWSADAGLDKLALMLSTAITKTELQEYDSVVFVAHSMGGLIVQRAILNEAEVAAKTHAVVLFGTPSGGLAKAGFIKRLKRQFRDMDADGEFIKRLRGDWNANYGDEIPFNFLAVAGSNDEFVPGESSLDPFPSECCAVVAGNHTSMIQPSELDPAACSLVVECIANTRHAADKIDSAQVAVERRDFRKVVAELEPRVEQLDSRALVLLAIALDALGEREKAEQYLSAKEGVGSDVLGTLGGRIKRKWLLSGRNASDAEAAQHYYATGLGLAKENEDLRQVYYLAINLAFLALVFEMKRKKARELAAEVLSACEACRAEGDGDDWLLATEGEAHLILGNYDSAYEKYQAYVNVDLDLWRLSSTYLNAQEIAVALDRNDVADAIDGIFPIRGQ